MFTAINSVLMGYYGTNNIQHQKKILNTLSLFRKHFTGYLKKKRAQNGELQVQVQVQVQNFIQKTFSGYTQVAYEKKEEQ